jgi:hypothetical protein
MKKILCVSVTLFATILSSSSQDAEILRFYVNSGQFQRTNTPVSVDLGNIIVNDSISLQLYEIVKGKQVEVPSQLESGYSQKLWFVMSGVTNAGSKREYVLYRSKGISYKNQITAVNRSGILQLKNSKTPILDYNIKMHYPPAGVDTMYKRNGFIHPMYSPSGNILTRLDAPDHYHHVGIWNPWTKVRIGNHVTDFWNLYLHQGTVRFAGVNSTTEGPVFGGFNVRQEHIDFQGKKPGSVIINEVWDVRAWNAEPVSGEKAWLVDFTSLLSVAGDSIIVLEAYRYGGGIGFRATAEWDKNNSWVNTSEGKTRINADGTKARWTDVGGMFAGKGESGIVFFSHPANREFPEPMRVWPMDQNNRGDVYFEFCPIRYKDWVLKPGNVYRQKYRMLVYDGKVDKAISDRVWNDFAYPPLVTVIKNQKSYF